MTTNNTGTPTQVVAVAPTYADVVKSAQTLNLADVCDVKTFDKLPEHLQTVIMTDLVKRVVARMQEVIGEALTSIDAELAKINTDVLTAIRVIMADNGMTAVNIKLTQDSFGVVKQFDKPASRRSTGTGTKTSKFTYFVNDVMVTGGSSAVAIALGIDTETDQYKKANGWLKIAAQAKAQGATITRTNAENDDTEMFAPEATTKEAHAVWFKK